MFQPAVDYGSLQVTRIHSPQAGWMMGGMCYFSGRLYTTEGREGAESVEYRLAAYNVTDQDTVTLLDALQVEDDVSEPCIDHQSGRVYFSCGFSGIYVVRYDGSKLVPITTLRCVVNPSSLAVVPPHTLYVCDTPSKTVCLVDVTQDRVTTRLQKPVGVEYSTPYNIAVLGDTVLVGAVPDSLAIYRHGVQTPGKLLPKPLGLRNIWNLTTDLHSSFLLVDDDSNTLYVMDISGNVTHSISIPGDRVPNGCAVVGGQLWVVCRSGDIIVMSSH